VERQFAPCTVFVPSGQGRKAPVIAIDTVSAAPGTPFALEMVGWEVEHIQHAVYRHWFARYLPGLDLRLRNPQPADIVAIARTYQLIWGIPDYTRQWIDRYWGIPSTLLHPPVDVSRFAPAPHKRSQILSVGRFFAGQHNKKHLVMIKAFKTLVDRGLHGWELHLAGGVNKGAEHARYLAHVQEAARGYPIHIYPDIPFAQLVTLYGESALYWHAAGYGEDEVRDPIKAEHFGITTVEAMAAGCVPVVIARGGQPELIRQGIDGFLRQSLDELIALTRELAGNAGQRQAIAVAAQAASRQFDLPAFGAALADSLVAAGIPVEVG
jgi:glycosyltransferase involved in cell wall biosynthesis